MRGWPGALQTKAIDILHVAGDMFREAPDTSFLIAHITHVILSDL